MVRGVAGKGNRSEQITGSFMLHHHIGFSLKSKWRLCRILSCKGHDQMCASGISP